MSKTKESKDVALLIKQMLANDGDLADLVEEESFNADIAIEIYNARQEKGISQAELASLVNTKQSVISRLESADYDGHSLAMLRRIGKALGKRLRVEYFAPQTLLSDCNPVSSRSIEAQWKATKSWQPDVSISVEGKGLAKAS